METPKIKERRARAKKRLYRQDVPDPVEEITVILDDIQSLHLGAEESVVETEATTSESTYNAQVYVKEYLL